MAILVKHNKVSTVPDTADTSLVRPSDWNADHTLTGFGTAAELNAGSANGVATLDAGGTVPLSQIPASLQGGVSYQGTWNATTNSPTLTSGVGTKGYYYVVAVAGSTNLDGITTWNVGDWAIFNGTAWEKVDNTDAVTSVNGYTGTVVLTQTDISGTANAPTNTNITSMTGVTGGISSPDFVQFDTTLSPVEAVAKLQWDDGNGTLQVGLKGGNVNLQIGQELVALCYNDSGVALTDGQIVYISGAQGNRVAVKLALATTDGTSAGTLGMVTEPIAINGQGFITVMGTVNKLNTSGLTEGAIIYLSPTTAGAYTTTKPTAPQHTVTLGYVERVSSTVGSIYIKVDNGYELDELHNVKITTPTGGQVLVYDQTAGYWKNGNFTDGTGISVTEATDGGITITNTAPDQVVSITGGGTTTVTGTYPNFTVSSDDQYDGTVTSVDLSAGTGISVSGGPITTSGSITVTNTAPDQTVVLNAGTGISTSGTYPNFTVTNTAPDQTVAISSGTGISVSGTYPNFTVTNTAPSSGGTVTSVSGTAPIASSGGNTPAISISQATTSTDGYLSSTDWNTFNNKQPAGTYVTSVGATSPVTSTGGTTPTIAMPAATSSVSGYLTSTDWTTFNSKASPFTYTSTYVPYGQGTTTPNQSSSFTFDANNTLNAPQVNASNGIHVNSATVSANYSIPSGSNAMSAGPVSIANGVTVTIPNGNNWVIV